MFLPYKNKITIDYEMSYFGFNLDRKSTKETWIVSARSVILRLELAGFSKDYNKVVKEIAHKSLDANIRTYFSKYQM